jgi:hypothetical protein
VLSNISPYACVSAILSIYLIWTLEFTLGDQDGLKKKWGKFVFGGGCFVVCVVYAVMNLVRQTTVKWGKDGKIPVLIAWEQGFGSFVIGGVLIILCIWDAYRKLQHGEYFAIPEPDEEYKEMLKCNNYAMQFSIASYLLISMLLGMSRSVVLETEAQLLLMCALALALLTYLKVYVRAYFEYVKTCVETKQGDEQKLLLLMDNPSDHDAMMTSIFQFTQIIGIVVAFVFFGIAFHVLFVLSDTQGAVLWAVFVFIGLYLCIYASEVVLSLLESFGVPCSTNPQWPMVYYLYSILGVLIVSITVLGAAATPSLGQSLSKLESVQYMAMANAAPNQNCTSGVQKNTLMHDMNVGQDSILKENNPVNFKVFHWTRWWEFAAFPDSLQQAPSLYLCSLGMEQYFGTCSAGYKKPATPFELVYQVIADEVKL